MFGSSFFLGGGGMGSHCTVDHGNVLLFSSPISRNITLYSL